MFEVLLLIVVIVGFLTLFLSMRHSRSPNGKELEALVHQVFGMSAQKVAEQSKTILQGEKESIKSDLDHKHHLLEKMVKSLQEDIAERQREIRLLEQDRVKKFGELSTSLAEHRELTQELGISTRQLAETLSNNQLRGGWGERIIEDLLQANGLLEGIHYKRQFQLGNSSLRPDITLLLPDKRVVAVDVKFPYSSMQKMLATSEKALKASHEKQFAQDIKQKIDKVAEYISPGENTLDYAILFVPNEMVFSFMNQRFPHLVDDAVSRRVLVVSPFTFLIVARTVMESYRNFLLGDKLKEIVQYVDEFSSEWDRFKGAFEKYGRTLGTLQSDYESLSSTRVRQMEKRVSKVKKLHEGGLVPELEEESTPHAN